MAEFLHNMSMQALNRKNDNILLDDENITDLVTNIIALLRQQSKKSQQRQRLIDKLIATISSTLI